MLNLSHIVYFFCFFVEFISGLVAEISDFTTENQTISMYFYGHKFLFNQTLENLLIMLELFSVQILDFITIWLLKYFVVNFVDSGEIWGEALACVRLSLVEYVRRRVPFFPVSTPQTPY